MREVLATTMLEALGVETSKSFSLIETGEALYRGDEPSPTRSSVLVRLSHSHIRIGTFQRLAILTTRQHGAVGRPLLSPITIRNLAGLPRRGQVPRLFGRGRRRVSRGSARRGSPPGFVHGVLNTDNINITGESFDYGPWRFLPRYDPRFTAAYFDESGLYAFGRQPDAMAWNLTRLAECLVPLRTVSALEPHSIGSGPHSRRALAIAVSPGWGWSPQGPETDGH